MDRMRLRSSLHCRVGWERAGGSAGLQYCKELESNVNLDLKGKTKEKGAYGDCAKGMPRYCSMTLELDSSLTFTPVTVAESSLTVGGTTLRVP